MGENWGLLNWAEWVPTSASIKGALIPSDIDTGVSVRFCLKNLAPSMCLRLFQFVVLQER